MMLFTDKIIGFLCGFGFGAVTIRSEVKAVSRFLKGKFETVVDCGGNKGLYVAEILRQNTNANIYVFEPNKLNYNHLKDRFVHFDKVQIINKAVSDSVGEMTLHSDKEGSGLASLSKRNMAHFNIEYNIEETVEVITLDAELPNISFDLLKFDIEGFELFALRGAKRVLKETKVVQFEFGGANIDTKTYFQDFFYFFRDLGFTLWRITPLGLRVVSAYSERMERFVTTNYIAVNNKMLK